MSRTVDPVSSPSPTTPMRRVAIASCTGTTIEFYDFFIYGTAAALVFPEVFFPALGAVAGTVASFATFAVAFVARPLGAALFGHFGDRIGRKKTLITTLLLMGIATVLIGLLPTAAQIGVFAPIALVVLRIAQGLAVGGECRCDAARHRIRTHRQKGVVCPVPPVGAVVGVRVVERHLPGGQLVHR